jgi:mRNA interferase MazF
LGSLRSRGAKSDQGLTVRRGDVFWAYLDPTLGSEQAGRRPVVVVSRDAIHNATSIAVVVPLTNRVNKQHIYHSQVEIRRDEGGLKADSVALCEQVRAISKERLREFLGHLGAARIAQVDAALKVALDL